MNNHKHSPTEAAMKLRLILAFAAITLAPAGCNDALSVSNPGAIKEGQLADPALVQLIVNGAIGEFQYAYGQYAQWSGVLADETFTDHTNVDVRDFSARFLDDQNSPGVVPDLFLITFSRRQTKVHVGITACHCKIFALTVHAKRCQMNTKFGGNQP